MPEPSDDERPLPALRSEAAMFRVVVIVGVAALPVIVIGLLAGALWGALVLLAEVLAGIALAARRWRARAAERHPRGDEPEVNGAG